MNIYQYIAVKNPHGAKRVVESFGGRAIRKPNLLAQQLADTVNQHGKEALLRVASVHPDADLLSHYFAFIDKKEAKNAPVKEDVFSKADGQEIKKAVEDIQKKPEKGDTKELLIIGAIVILGLALIKK